MPRIPMEAVAFLMLRKYVIQWRANKKPMKNNGRSTFLFNNPEKDFGLRKIANNNVANDNLKMAIVTGVALVNLINTGTSDINSNVMAASAPTLKFPCWSLTNV
jgi:hypothetical protein